MVAYDRLHLYCVFEKAKEKETDFGLERRRVEAEHVQMAASSTQNQPMREAGQLPAAQASQQTKTLVVAAAFN